MSLIQNALDKAGFEDPSPVPAEVSAPVVSKAAEKSKQEEKKQDASYEGPRLKNIQFYESIAPKKMVPSLPSLPKIDFQSKRMLYIAIGVFLLFSLFAGRFLMRPLKNDVAVSTAPAFEKTQEAVVKTQTPFTQKTISKIKFVLTGVTSTDHMLLALINNQVVGVGDRLRENAVVKSIAENSVEIEYQGKPIKLSI